LKAQIKSKDWQLFLLFIGITIISTIIVIKWEHSSRDIANIWVFFLKLLPFFSALLAIAYMPGWFKKPWDLLLIFLSFVVVFPFIIAKLAYYIWNPDPVKCYLIIQILIPYLILCLAFAYKTGGGNKKDTIVLGLTSIIFMLSGIEDVAYFAINPHTGSFFQALPDKWTWTSHITVRVGRIIDKYEIFIFIGIHFALIVLILYFAYSKKNVLLFIKEKLTGKKSQDKGNAGK
jgi:hypothetical protein